MAGILNKKERIMDVIVTREGRRQMADGNLRATFASFTDSMAFYESDSVSGSTDPTDRIYFEAFSTEADQIIYESDDSGRLVGEINQPNLTIFGDQVFKKNPAGEFLEITGSVFASEVESIVTASIFNFKSQQIISSEKGDKYNNKQFDLTRNKIYFDIDNFKPFGMNPNEKLIDLQAATPLFFDRRLANLSQFKYLPPIKTDGTDVANFTNVQSTSNFGLHEMLRSTVQDPSYQHYPSDLFPVDDNNFDNNQNAEKSYLSLTEGLADLLTNEAPASNDYLQRESISFINTSDKNKLFCQVFEVNAEGNNKKLVKLDVLPMGTFPMDEAALNVANTKGLSQAGHETKQFFYVGKVFEDDFGVPSFIRLFTLMFD